MAKRMLDAGPIVLCAFIGPFRAQRQIVRDLLAQGEFVGMLGGLRLTKNGFETLPSAAGPVAELSRPLGIPVVNHPCYCIAYPIRRMVALVRAEMAAVI